MRFPLYTTEVYGGRSIAKPRDGGFHVDSTVRQDPSTMGPISLREASTPPAANTPEIPDTSNSADTLTFAKINYTSIAQSSPADNRCTFFTFAKVGYAYFTAPKRKTFRLSLINLIVG